MSSIGDIILTSPLVRQLRENFPEAQIDFLVRSEYADLVKFNPHLSHILQYDIQTGWKGLRELKEFIGEQGYAVVLDLHRNLRSYYLRKISPRPIVLKVNKNRLIRFLLVKFKLNFYERLYEHIPSVAGKYLRAASDLCQFKNDLKLELFLPQNIADKGKQLWKKLEKENFAVIMAPGARHFTKRWPSEMYSELIANIHQTYGWRTLLVGSSAETSLIQAIQEKAGTKACESVAGYFGLLETAALIKAASVFISNDSGLMHVAAAYQIPQIAIFGSTVRELGFFPINPNSEVIENQGLECRPCTHIGRKSCPKKHFKCMLEITPAKVLDAFKELVRKGKIKHPGEKMPIHAS